MQLNKFITIKNKGFHFRAYMDVYKEKKPLGMKIKWLSVEFFNFRGYVILIHFYYLSLILTRLLSYIRHAFTLLCKPFRLGWGNLHDHCLSALVLSQTPVNDRPVTASVPVPRHHSNTDDPLPLKQWMSPSITQAKLWRWGINHRRSKTPICRLKSYKLFLTHSNSAYDVQVQK